MEATSNLYYDRSGQQKLFPVYEMVQRPTPEKTDFEKEYYDFLTSMPVIFDNAFEKTKAARKTKSKMSMLRPWFATEMNGNVLDLVAQSFPLLVKATGRGSFCIYLNYKYECYLKKLMPKNLFPSYNHTNTTKRHTDQMALKKEQPIPIIYLGWTLDKGNDKITGYYAVCRKGSERLWHSDLTCIKLQDIDVRVEENNVVPEVKVIIKKREKKKNK